LQVILGLEQLCQQALGLLTPLDDDDDDDVDDDDDDTTISPTGGAHRSDLVEALARSLQVILGLEPLCQQALGLLAPLDDDDDDDDDDDETSTTGGAHRSDLVEALARSLQVILGLEPLCQQALGLLTPLAQPVAQDPHLVHRAL
jgi:hypothetical protein